MAPFRTFLMQTASIVSILSTSCASAALGPTVPYGRPAVVSASNGTLDLFVIAGSGDGYVTSTGSDPAIQSTQFSAWRSLPFLDVPSEANLTAIVDDSKIERVFVVASNGTIHTLSFRHSDHTIGDSWRPIGGLETRPGSTIAAIMFDKKVQLVAVGIDGHVAATSLTVANDTSISEAPTWSTIGDVKTTNIATTGISVTNDGRVHAFVTGNDGLTYAAERNQTSDIWSAWERIAAGQAAPGAAISAVSRSVGQLDVWAVGLNDVVWTAAKHPGDTSWRGWWEMPGFTTLPGIEVGAISRQVDTLDVFCPDSTALRIYRNWWPGTGINGWFGAWKHSNSGLSLLGTSVVLVSKAPGTVDAIVTGTDGNLFHETSLSIDGGFCGWWLVGEKPLTATCDGAGTGTSNGGGQGGGGSPSSGGEGSPSGTASPLVGDFGGHAALKSRYIAPSNSLLNQRTKGSRFRRMQRSTTNRPTQIIKMDIRFLDDSARSDPLYVNLEYLGEGGQAKVYKVKRVNDRLIMACKEIIVTLDATELHLIKRELESWAMINRKKYIAEYYDASWGPATNSIRLYMPLYKGGDLHKVLETALMEKQPLHPIVTSLCANEIAQGVQECHERDIIHRDLKPENVLLSSPFKLNTQLWKAAKGEFLTSTEKRELAAFLRARTTGIPWCHVADFGMAKITSKLLGNSHHGTRATFGQMGTPGFIAPETIDLTGTNAAKFTSKSDVYGLGCLIYCLCEGSPPFPHRVEPSKRVYKPISAQYPQQFRSLVERCVSLSPASRPGIRELTSDLKRLHKQILAENHWVDEFLSSNSALPLSPSSQSRPTRSRSPDTMMSLNNQLLEACKEGDAESARAALSAGASTSAVGSEQFYRYSPLHYAAKGGFVNVMEVILEYGVDINMKTPTLGGTALHIAVIGGHYDAVDYLISMNAFVNAKTKQHMTPIWGAVLPEGGKFDEVMLLKLLSRGADINAPNNKGWTILHGLAVEKDEDYVERMRVFLRGRK
ncbi:hypothetical protein B0H63DRAFT_451072 [Podospora didyma]|uniref:non-specific serine/threonine protein kinase n=1 Tax=Podospora didyma TaxID=330526 RepID=A0AAE0NHX3_9PEZI|nr:hypothetical protein B0H63DRAFT_451072 [Podospora didyma]